jgi:hypothetical protein
MRLYRCPCCGLVYAFEPSEHPLASKPEDNGCQCGAPELEDITEALFPEES